MPGDHVKYQVSSVYLFFQVIISKDVWDIPVWNLAPSPVPGVVRVRTLRTSNFQYAFFLRKENNMAFDLSHSISDWHPNPVNLAKKWVNNAIFYISQKREKK